MNTNALNTVANALKNSVAGDSVKKTASSVANPSKSATDPITVDGVVLDGTTKSSGAPFLFDYTKLDELRKAYNAGDDNKLAELLQDNVTFIARQDVTDNELKRLANEAVDEKYDILDEKVNISADTDLTKLRQNLFDKVSRAETESEKAKGAYLSGVEETRDSAVRQGIIRSSIYDGMMGSLTEALERETDRIETELARVTETISVQMEYVERERERALKDYDLKRAEEYGKKLSALRSEEYAARQEVIEYNKRVAEWKSDLQKARRSYAAEIIAIAGKNGLYNH